jgi:hypothetical protein
MSKSNSNLLNYISLLLNDDDALNQFLIDPIQAEDDHGITKAERAVLRRTVAHLSNKSKNGYTVSRHLGSYRRSLRLLQNVLHNVGSKIVQDVHISTEDSDPSATYSMRLYFPYYDVPGQVNLTGKTNADVENKYNNAYTYSIPLKAISVSQNKNENVTIQDLMNAYKDYIGKDKSGNYIFDYKTVLIDGVQYVSDIKFGKLEILANISDPRYNLTNNPKANFVFWFYSISGQSNKGANPGVPGTPGTEGESFATKTLSAGDVVSWAVIAPDSEYGFASCDTTEGNKNPNS